MLKDRAQKAAALRLAVSKRWVPHLEVEVEPSTQMESRKFLLTDLDVLAIAPSVIGSHSRLVFDCKSGVRESAIGRTFWLKGVMSKVAANHGFIVMNDKISISQDHRVSAAELSISLLHERDFETLAVGIGGSTGPFECAANSIDAWEAFLAIGSKFPSTVDYLEFSRSRYWMLKDPGEQCRKTVAKLRSIRGELDPAKPEHAAIFGDALCLFLLCISELSNRLFLVLFHPETYQEFSLALLALLYGGHENVETAQRIRRVTSGLSEEDPAIFPELQRFEQLVREILQAPQQTLAAALFARDYSLSCFDGCHFNDLQASLAKESPHAPKFVLMAAEYLQRATKAPVEFAQIYGSAAMRSLV